MVKEGEKSAEESPMQTTHAAAAEAAILSRLVKPSRADFTPEVAEALLKLDFDQTDRDRMHELTVKNQEGILTKAEEEELQSYRRIGYFVDLIRSKARISLKKHGR
jgi:copper oxidase (laccase) domain-containing protein